MRISVIIPTYKPGDYIWDCFDSLQNQNCSLDNFEVVAVLNGDKEPFLEQIFTYLKNSKLHYKLIYTEKKGVSNARNIGIDYSIKMHMDYILFLDDDDKLSSSFITDCLSKADPNYIVVCNSKTFRNNSDNLFGEDYITRCYNKNKGKNYNVFSYRCFFSTVSAKLIPVNMIGNTRFDTQFKIGEDSLFVFTISLNIGKCVLSEKETIYFRRIRQESASRYTLNKIESVKNNLKIIAAYSNVFFKKPTKYSVIFYMSRLAAEVICVIKTVFGR